jgi:hypothetical protein
MAVSTMFSAEYIKKMITLRNNDVATRASSSSHIEYHFLEDSFEHDKDVVLNLLQNEVNFLCVFVIFRRDHVRFQNNHHDIIMISSTNIPFDHHWGYLLLGNYLTCHAPSSPSISFILYDGSSNQGPNHLVTVTHLFDQQWWLMGLWLYSQADSYHSRDLNGEGFECDCRDCKSIVANKTFVPPFRRKPILHFIKGTKIYYSTSDGHISSNGGDHLVYLGMLFTENLLFRYYSMRHVYHYLGTTIANLIIHPPFYIKTGYYELYDRYSIPL